MSEVNNRVVQVRRFGDPDELELVDAPLPTARRGEVRVRVLASSVEYTDVVIRRRLYAQTMLRRPPLVLGYNVVGEIDQLGDGAHRDENVAAEVRSLRRINASAHLSLCKALLMGG